MEILGIGTVVVDDVVLLDRIPEPDTKAAYEARWRQVGGPVPTALVTATRLGSQCAFAGKWGADAEGVFIENDLQAEGLDLSRCVREAEGTSGFAQVWIDASRGTRSIAFSRGQLAPLASTQVALPADLKLLHVDGAHGEAAVAAARAARDQGALVVLDAGSMKSHTEVLFELADVLVASRQFFRSVTGVEDPEEAAGKFREAGVLGGVLLTLGDEGVRVFPAEGAGWSQAAFPVEVVDTTGAGDVFCGGVIHGLAAGMSLADSVRIGCASAAFKCAARGNRALPDWSGLVSRFPVR